MSAVTAGARAGGLLGGERGQREPQVAVAGIAEQAGGTDDGRLAGPGPHGERGDGEVGAAGRVARDGLRDPLHGAGHRRRRACGPWRRGPPGPGA